MSEKSVSGKNQSLFLRYLGGIRVERDGQEIPLPQSRKTRALLAYLIMTARPQRRDRLSAMFWDLTDDPRAALRWSLTKLRALLDDEETSRLQADRDRIAIDVSRLGVDVLEVRALLSRGIETLTIDELEGALSQFRGEFLEGLELGDSAEFQAWCVAEREQARTDRLRLLGETVRRLSDAPDRAIPYARELVVTDPGDDSHRKLLATLMERTRNAAPDPVRSGSRMFRSIGKASETDDAKTAPKQEIRFTTAPDKVRLAFATSGEGEPVVKAANWLNHLEFDWESPIWRHVIRTITQDHRLIRYDERGNGLSDWEVGDISFETFVRDLETVVDAAEVERFALLGISQGAAVSIAYAVRHPERVSKLILHGGYAVGSARRSREEAARREAMRVLVKEGWGQDNPAFRQMFTSFFIPDANREQEAWFNELQRVTTSPELALRLAGASGDIDIADLLPRVTVPTLVLHSRNEAVVPFAQGRLLATSIPGARFVPLESRNHLILEEEPAWMRFRTEVLDFLGS